MRKIGIVSCLMMLFGIISVSLAQDHLLITEIANRPIPR